MSGKASGVKKVLRRLGMLRDQDDHNGKLAEQVSDATDRAYEIARQARVVALKNEVRLVRRP